jgi:hypothetical protein
MGLHYSDLDGATRILMMEEVAADAANGTLYICKRLTEAGEKHWEALLRDALAQGNDATLAGEILRRGYLERYEVRYREGRPCRARVPATAADTLAESEFNRYYCRAVCRRSLEEGDGFVEVYRAKVVRAPRHRSEHMVGTLIDAEKLLADLRAHSSIDVTLGISSPNSGLSVKLTPDPNTRDLNSQQKSPPQIDAAPAGYPAGPNGETRSKPGVPRAKT